MRTTGRLPFSFRPPDIPHGPKGTCRARQTSRFELDVVGHCKRVVVVERGKGSDYRTLSDLASPRFFFLLQIDFGQGTDTIFAYTSLYQKLPVAFRGITLRPKFEAEAPKMVVYILYPEYLHDSSQVVHVKTGELEKLQADSG
ncbi:hypothetical protein FRC20_001552 [Serendipita sp. 405]|nr:hypothetical protein FRC15_003435 [Serendipita sp. 397]KAG8852297.1 hypothetical protein FRC20_001552 [Serendipita sp. 405]